MARYTADGGRYTTIGVTCETLGDVRELAGALSRARGRKVTHDEAIRDAVYALLEETRAKRDERCP